MRVLLSVPKFLISKHQNVSLHKMWHFCWTSHSTVSALLLFIETAKTRGKNISGDLFFVSCNKYEARFGGILNSYRKHLLNSSVITIRHSESRLKAHRNARAALWKPTSTSLQHTLQLFTSEAGVPSHLTADASDNRSRLSGNSRCLLPPSIKDNDSCRFQQLQRTLQRGFQEWTSAYVAMAANQTWPIQTSGEWMTTPRSNREPALEVKQLHQMQETTGRIDWAVDIAITAILSDSSQYL